jgi:hypothetical protein
MPSGPDLRRQEHIGARLADGCGDEHIAQRPKQIGLDLQARADEGEELPSEGLRNRYVADLLRTC